MTTKSIGNQANDFCTYLYNTSASGVNWIKESGTDLYNNIGPYFERFKAVVGKYLGQFMEAVKYYGNQAKVAIVDYYNRARNAFAALPEEQRLAALAGTAVATVVGLVWCRGCNKTEKKPDGEDSGKVKPADNSSNRATVEENKETKTEKNTPPAEDTPATVTEVVEDKSEVEVPKVVAPKNNKKGSNKRGKPTNPQMAPGTLTPNKA